MEEKDKINDLKSRLKTLQNVAIEINSALADQNKKMESNESLFDRCFKQINTSIRKIKAVNRKRFNSTLYMFLFTVFMCMLLYVFLF
ncbi:BET1 like protein [Tubulinosema ratisbonensis]|uniref:BET1 like protein n=1 Tax=Tubulinosema ratisbonensis TaxID=291195 RepID=A0A437AMP9_9MICR|nr:BET1 like protein [Tubulinosema ratisbonensis]